MFSPYPREWLQCGGSDRGCHEEEAIDRLAEQYGFPVHLLDKINSLDSVSLLKTIEADLFILCGYNKIIKNQLLRSLLWEQLIYMAESCQNTAAQHRSTGRSSMVKPLVAVR